MSDGLELGLDLKGLDHEPKALKVDAAQLTEAISNILKDADLEKLSRRMIRNQLEEDFHSDLSSYKDVINATILAIIEQQQTHEDESEPDPSDEEIGHEERTPRKPAAAVKKKATPKKRKRKSEDDQPRKPVAAVKKKATPKKRKRKSEDDHGKKAKAGTGGFNATLCLSPELADVIGADTMARPQLVKALWAYIREHDLQDPSNRKNIILDDALRRVFQRDAFTMFTMNKFVKRHVRKPDDLPPGGWSQISRDGLSSEEDTEAKVVKKEAIKRKKRKSSANDPDNDSKSERKNPFNIELAVSPELASLIGSDRMARPQIVKALWAYIHEHQLQDPNDKRTILLDDRMKAVFQRDSFTMFSMNKYIKRHARKVDDVPSGGWSEIPRDGFSSDEDKTKKEK
ncbi:hypothetical protein CCR75_005566 [Bremia lactucae]|uniref:DM2 domain-containing protein n=1 Tax=Bremia lactucae TaxID=4779 RepID=A0A976IDN6_BRELC|nr:hypothetical protein CCR75_005566 [Bremia lactucae]